jgi:hypothetical protein
MQILPKTIFDIQGIGLAPSILRLLYLVLNTFPVELTSKEFLLSSKRLIIAISCTLFLFSLMIWNHLGFFLDDLLFPDWRAQVIDSPLFIVGNARSGTTWLHRLISLDDKTFTTMQTWEIGKGPAASHTLSEAS